MQFGGWDQKLVDHNMKSNGKLDEAVNELRNALGLNMQTGLGLAPGGDGAVSDERLNIRQQLFSGSFGQNVGVGPGRW